MSSAIRSTGKLVLRRATLADIPKQSPRGPRRNGFLDCDHGQLPHSVLSVSDPSQPPGSSISIAPNIPLVNGSYNSCARRSPTVPTTSTSSSIAMRILAPQCSISWNLAEFLPCGRVTGAHGKTELLNAPQRTTQSCDRARRKPSPEFGSRLPALLPSRSYTRGLNKDTPAKRPALCRNAGERLQSMPRLGGLHHRYFWEKLHERCACNFGDLHPTSDCSQEHIW
jgi:hypothetical protein